MARDLEFDRESALDLALDQFWTRGFHDTSMRDLAERTGVSLSSLYNTFGDKRAIFLAVLDRYDSVFLSARLNALERYHQPLKAIQVFFESVVEECLSDPDRKGCFLVNTALELSPHDEAIEAQVRKRLERMEAFLHRALARARKAGDLPDAIHPKLHAARLLATLLGVRVLARAHPEPRQLKAILEGVLEGLKA